MSNVTVTLVRAALDKWGLRVMSAGSCLESYPATMGLREALFRAAALFRLHRVPNRNELGIVDVDSAVVVEPYRLVELKLEEVLASLLETVKRETAHSDDHVIGPAIEFSLQLSYGHSGVCVSHGPKAGDFGTFGQAEPAPSLVLCSTVEEALAASKARLRPMMPAAPIGRKFSLIAYIHSLISELCSMGEPFPDVSVASLSLEELDAMALALEAQVKDALGLS